MRASTTTWTGRPALDGYREKLTEKNIPGITCLRRRRRRDRGPGASLSLRACHPGARQVSNRHLPRARGQTTWASGPVAPPNDNHDPRQYMDDPDSEELGEMSRELKPGADRLTAFSR